MTSQPPLLDPSGGELPSPLFTPQPGWGGRLAGWLRDNLYMLVFRVVVFSAVALILISLVRSWRAPRLAEQSPSPSASPLSQNWTFQTAAAAGQGMTHLAAWAVDAYLSQHTPKVALTAVEHLYAVDSLARQSGWRRLALHEEARFSADDIAAVIEKAKALTAAQRAAWARFLRR